MKSLGLEIFSSLLSFVSFARHPFRPRCVFFFFFSFLPSKRRREEEVEFVDRQKKHFPLSLSPPFTHTHSLSPIHTHSLSPPHSHTHSLSPPLSFTPSPFSLSLPSLPHTQLPFPLGGGFLEKGRKYCCLPTYLPTNLISTVNFFSPALTPPPLPLFFLSLSLISSTFHKNLYERKWRMGTERNERHERDESA